VIVIGVDPGLTGAIVAIDSRAGVIECADMPTAENGIETGSMKRWVCAAALRDLLAEWSGRHEFARESVLTVLERPIPMPSLPAQTIASQFDTFGVLRAELERLAKLQVITPQEWKKFYGIGHDKDKARTVATTLYPDAAAFFKRIKDHNRAEACLIAHWLLRRVA
jgi:hypothetical protein